MIEITRIMDINIEPTVKEIADSIAEMDSMQHADLLNILADKIKTRDAPLSMQLQSISDEQMLTKEARFLMTKIGEYSAPY